MVVDTSVFIALVTDSGASGKAAAERLSGLAPIYAPHGADLEFANVVRRMARAGDLTATAGRRAIDRYLTLPVERYPHEPLLPRVWELRDSVTTYDAAFVALAELLQLPLLTADERLARAHGPRCPVEVLGGADCGG